MYIEVIKDHNQATFDDVVLKLNFNATASKALNEFTMHELIRVSAFITYLNAI
jgi:hypothetical protein